MRVFCQEILELFSYSFQAKYVLYFQLYSSTVCSLSCLLCTFQEIIMFCLFFYCSINNKTQECTDVINKWRKYCTHVYKKGQNNFTLYHSFNSCSKYRIRKTDIDINNIQLKYYLPDQNNNNNNNTNICSM